MPNEPTNLEPIKKRLERYTKQMANLAGYPPREWDAVREFEKHAPEDMRALLDEIKRLEDMWTEQRFRIVSARMKLHCPQCGQRHIDRGEFETRRHHVHKCEYTPEGKTGCGHEWESGYYSQGVAETDEERIANSVAVERERCAKSAEECKLLSGGPGPLYGCGWNDAMQHFAKGLRDRS